MRVFKQLLLTACILLTGLATYAQSTEGATFSLYSQYGLGELSPLGTAASKGMGGVGVASREMSSMNLLNPASYTSIVRQRALLSISGEGMNNYTKTTMGSNSRNNFNLGHIGLQFRLSKKFGFGLVVAPYSNMGYELTITDKSPDVMTDIGNVKYIYEGSGGIAQFKTGLAYNVVKNLNIGVNYIYYLGSFKQNSWSNVTSYISTEYMRNFYRYNTGKVNQSSFEIGAQYEYKLKDNQQITFGATFQPKISSQIKRDVLVTTNNNFGYPTSSGGPSSIDTVYSGSPNENFEFPMRISGGINYSSTKLIAELNYTFQDWGKSFPDSNVSNIGYSSVNEIRGGIQYTPNRYDIRSPFKRWSYRAGFAYSTSYIVKNGFHGKDISGSIGIGVPMEKAGLSLLNASLEVGKSGALKEGQARNTFVKLNIGFSFFSKRAWFVRQKYE